MNTAHSEESSEEDEASHDIRSDEEEQSNGEQVTNRRECLQGKKGALLEGMNGCEYECEEIQSVSL